MKKKENQFKPNTYVFECHRCGCTAFKCIKDGYSLCYQCNKKYSWVSAFDTWVPHAMSAEEYIIKVLRKKWDPKKKKFL